VHYASATDCCVRGPAFSDREGGQGWRTRTSVRRMEEGERAQEIARMLSGAKVTESSLEHARSLLKSSR